MIGIIPAAGLGTRLGATGIDTPKCLLRVGDEILIDRVIHHLKRAGIKDIFIVIGHLGDKVKEHLLKRNDLNLIFVEQKQFNGLPGALSVVNDYIENEDTITYCPDNYFTDYYDIETAIQIYRRHKPDIVVCVEKTRPRQNRACLNGAFEKNYDKPVEIQNIQGSDNRNLEVWTSTGLWIQNKYSLSLCSRYIVSEKGDEQRLYNVWAELLSNGKNILAHRLLGHRYDISSHEDLIIANDVIKKQQKKNSRGVAVIIKTIDGKYVLMQRDDKSTIRYPGYWALFGGTADPGEKIEDAAKRELHEELGLQTDNLQLVDTYYENLKTEYVFITEINRDLSELTLNEGKQFCVFSKKEMLRLKIRNDDLASIIKYLETYDS